jgi:aspartate racemase
VDREDALPEVLAGEMEERGAETEVAYRAGQRFVTGLERMDFSTRASDASLFERGGFYVISGGAGGVGRLLTERLLGEFDARILWIGRSPAPAALPSDAVAYEVADVTEAEAVRRAIGRTRARFGRRLAGAIHLAGSAPGRTLVEETPETIEEIVRTKVEGARVLESILGEEGGGLLVAFSSVNSFFGGAGLGAYAVANRMLESFMATPGHARVRRVCVAWSAWDGIGMNRTFAGNDASREHGFDALGAEPAWRSLGAVLHAGLSEACIGLDGSHPFVARHRLDAGANLLLELCAVTESTRRATLQRAARELSCGDVFGTRTHCTVEGVAALPRTAAGEVDRARLGGAVERGARAPGTSTERRLAEIWREVLGVNTIGADADFFALGGHSLRATQLMSRVRDVFRVELPLQIVFQWPTVAGLAAQIDRASPQALAMERTPIQRAARQGEFALSFAQERLWFFDQLVPGQSSYNIPTAVRLRGRLDRAALEKSFREIIRRHETLRTTLRITNDVPVQVIGQDAPLSWEVTDLEMVPETQRETRLRELLVQEAALPFDLSCGPLLRVRLFQLVAEEHVLLVTLHHIVSDGWSQGVLVRELGALYEAFAGGRPVSLPELRIQYADYAQWQRQSLHGRLLEEQLTYWKAQLGGELPVLDLPTDRPRPSVQTFRGATQTFAVPGPVVDALKGLSQREGATLFMPLLAAFQTLLARYTGLEDILVGTPIANRNRVEVEGLIGFLANTLVLRTSLAGNPPFRELVQRVKQTALGAYGHQDLPFEKLVEALNPQRDLGRQPLFQVMFVWQNAPLAEMNLAGLSLQPVDLDIGVSLFDLTLYLEETPTGVRGVLEYNTDLFDAETMARLAGHYVTLLEGAAADPSQRAMQLPMLTEPERRRVVVDWNRTEVVYPRDRCVHELFEEQAAQRPDAVAVVFGEQQVSYGDLNRRANQLAHHLEKLGVGPETPVGLALERSVEMMVGLLGILKAGGAYVPLDAGYPKARLAFMIEDARVSVLVTRTKWLERLPELSGRVVCVDRDEAVLAQAPAENKTGRTGADGLAYIMYTSGSTGQPKGVSVVHRGIVRLVRGADYVSFGPEEVFLQLAPISFDASTFEIWGALLNGARLVVMPPETPTLEDLGVALRWHGVTTLWLTADLFHLMVDERLEDLKGVRQLVAGGDVLSLPHVQRALEARGLLKLVNGYGPTESTTFACCHRMDRTSMPAGSVPIGRPIANTQVYLLDPWDQPVPVGVAGELCLGGDGLARGYWRQEELTQQKFAPNPLPEVSGARAYRTGDLAKYRADGVIEFLGRRDRQVKVRGFRVELAEVEAALRQHPNLKQVVVLASGDDVKCVAGYFVPRELPAPTAAELREFLLGKLPEQFVPSLFVPLEALPMTPAGKVDASALAARGGPRVSADETVAPHDLLEVQLKQIWERVLGLRAISVRENFFDLGGHSLLAVKLFSQIEKVTGKHLPLATLFEAPTIEQLARVLKHGGWTAPWSSLVSIQPGGTRRPFFIIHGVGGNVLNFHDLARHLGEDQPVYGLQSRGLDGKLPPVTRIEDMAAHYIREIRSIQPTGPYALGGMSFGGVVAYEMARQLAADGEKVALLALLDSYALGHSELIPITERYRREMGVWTRRVKMYWRNLFHAPPGGRARYVRSKLKTLRRRLQSRVWQIVYKVLSKSGRTLAPALLSVKEANFMAAKDYVTKPYSGRVTLFVASEQPIEGDPRDVWSHLALGGVEVYQIPGDHVTLLEEPNVQVLSERLQACLRSTTDAPA